MLKKQIGNGFGFTEPRIMLRLCLVALYALKFKKQDIFDEAVSYIRSFEIEYDKKYFSNVPEGANISSPTPDQLLQEMLSFSQKKYWSSTTGRLLEMDETEDRILEIVEQKDIENFITKVWGVTEFTYSYPFGI